MNRRVERRDKLYLEKLKIGKIEEGVNGYIFIAGRNSKGVKYELFCRVVNTGLKCSANSYEIQKNRRVERRDKLCLEKLKKSCRVEEEVNGRERKFERIEKGH